jgi:hypothetical protein
VAQGKKYSWDTRRGLIEEDSIFLSADTLRLQLSAAMYIQNLVVISGTTIYSTISLHYASLLITGFIYRVPCNLIYKTLHLLYVRNFWIPWYKP